MRKVSDYLEESPRTFSQPGAAWRRSSNSFSGASSDAAKTPVHILHFGDSHTAADDWTGGLRDLFKAKFGDGGSGFRLAGHPFLGYRRFDAHGGGSPLWQSAGFRSATGDGFFGLGGVSISTDHAGQSVYLDAECDSLEVEYLQQPAGGDLELYDSEQRLDEFSTAGDLAPGFVRYQVSPGQHRFTLRTLNVARVPFVSSAG